MFYLYHGPDEFSAHEELDRLRATGGFEFNQDRFSGAETDLATIRTTCDTLPFLSERRLVVVAGLPRRTRGGDSETGDQGDDATEEAAAPVRGVRGTRTRAAAGTGPRAFIQGLADYVAHLPSTTVLVVLVEEVLEPTHPLLRAARAHGTVRSFTRPRGAQLEAWVTRRAREHDVTLAAEAVRALIEAAGDNLRVLASEVDKLSTYVGASGTVSAADVQALTPQTQELRIFDLTDALVGRERERAIALLHELLASGSAPLALVGMIAFQTRTLLQVKALSERGLRAPQIAQMAALAPYVVEKSLRLARGCSTEQLESALRLLLEVDIALKRSRMSPDMALDLLMLDFGTSAG